MASLGPWRLHVVGFFFVSHLVCSLDRLAWQPFVVQHGPAGGTSAPLLYFTVLHPLRLCGVALGSVIKFIVQSEWPIVCLIMD